MTNIAKVVGFHKTGEVTSENFLDYTHTHTHTRTGKGGSIKN